MAGHSKWHNIRIRKGKQDAIRGKIFTKLAREITIAAKAGGGAPETNPRLRLAIDKAREQSMPVDNIQRAIKRGTGELEDANYEEIVYEGYGPGGVAVMLECTTDNKNRTVSEIRHLFSKHGGNLSESGSVSWQFKRQGVIQIPVSAMSEEAIMDLALEAGAEDVNTEEEFYTLTTAPEEFHAVRDKIAASSVEITNAELQLVPTNTVRVEGDTAGKLLKLLDLLEEHDDVQNAYANFDMPDDVLAGSAN